METRLLTRVRESSSEIFKRPLSLQESIVLVSILLFAGTVYCQIYCLLAFQEMHGKIMPLRASIHRAAVEVLPAYWAFELWKRLPLRGRMREWIIAILILTAAVALGVALRSTLIEMSSGLTFRRMAADRLPLLLLAVAGAARFHLLSTRGSRARNGTNGHDEAARMPPAKFIDWIQAAGNYVEVHIDGRTRLLRMTLRQAAALLPPEQFVQIHRSIIVNRDRIAQIHDRRNLLLRDGTRLGVGDAYRGNLASR